MGSKLRRLRAKAGVTGLAHQKREREAYRLRERARRTERAKLEFQDGNVIVGVNSKGGQLRSSEQLRDALAALPAALPGSSDLAFHRIRLEEQRIQLAHILGSHDGSSELADAIHLAAVKRAQESVNPNHEVIEDVWADALRQLRSGVASGDLTVLKGPKGLEVHAKAHQSAAALIAATGKPFTAAPEAPAGNVYDAEAIELKVGGEVVPQVPERRPPAAGMRMSRVLPLLAVAMMAGLAVPPKGDR